MYHACHFELEPKKCSVQTVHLLKACLFFQMFKCLDYRLMLLKRGNTPLNVLKNSQKLKK